MPTKRVILAELTRDELRTNVDYYELEVEDRRVKTQLVDALARSRQVPLDEILQDLSRDRLKELCRAFDLDDSGRKKADLAARLMGRTAASKDADASAAMPPAVSASVTDKLSVAQLEQSLWSAADILRGSIDSSDQSAARRSGAFPISRSRAHTHRRHGHPLQTVPSTGLIERPQEKNRVDALR